MGFWLVWHLAVVTSKTQTNRRGAMGKL